MELNAARIGSIPQSRSRPLRAGARGGTGKGKHGWNRRRTVNIPSIGLRTGRRILIEDIYPSVEGGRFAVKRIAGEPVSVWADLVRDGNAVLAADLLWRPGSAGKWLRTPLQPHGNDRWTASFTPPTPGRYEYAIEAWTDVFATWRRDLLAKRQAGLDVSLEMLEGRQILEDLKPRNAADARLVRDLCRDTDTGSLDRLLLDEVAAAAATDQQTDLTRSAAMPLVADRPLARAGAWYEMVPRSQGSVPGRHGTFDDCIARLPEIAALGFDVVYLHPDPSDRPHQPQGTQQRPDRQPRRSRQPLCHRLGRRRPRRDPSASSARSPISAASSPPARDHGMEVALDFAVQCSPDHPWIARASGMVQAPARRLDPICGEPAEEIPGHRQSGFLRRRCRTGSGWRCATWSCSGSRRACASSGSTIRTPSRFRSGNG